MLIFKVMKTESKILTLNDLASFKKKYCGAKKKGSVSFMFKGDEILTDYAKYAIEFFNLKFAKR